MVDNRNLDFRSKDQRGWGYAVFGRVTQGMDVVDSIRRSRTSNQGGAFRNLPDPAVVIHSVKRIANEETHPHD